jgi:hypothetical protein
MARNRTRNANGGAMPWGGPGLRVRERKITVKPTLLREFAQGLLSKLPSASSVHLDLLREVEEAVATTRREIEAREPKAVARPRPPPSSWGVGQPDGALRRILMHPMLSSCDISRNASTCIAWRNLIDAGTIAMRCIGSAREPKERRTKAIVVMRKLSVNALATHVPSICEWLEDDKFGYVWMPIEELLDYDGAESDHFRWREEIWSIRYEVIAMTGGLRSAALPLLPSLVRSLSHKSDKVQEAARSALAEHLGEVHLSTRGRACVSLHARAHGAEIARLLVHQIRRLHDELNGPSCDHRDGEVLISHLVTLRLAGERASKFAVSWLSADVHSPVIDVINSDEARNAYVVAAAMDALGQLPPTIASSIPSVVAISAKLRSGVPFIWSSALRLVPLLCDWELRDEDAAAFEDALRQCVLSVEVLWTSPQFEEMCHLRVLLCALGSLAARLTGGTHHAVVAGVPQLILNQLGTSKLEGGDLNKRVSALTSLGLLRDPDYADQIGAQLALSDDAPSYYRTEVQVAAIRALGDLGAVPEKWITEIITRCRNCTSALPTRETFLTYDEQDTRRELNEIIAPALESLGRIALPAEMKEQAEELLRLHENSPDAHVMNAARESLGRLDSINDAAPEQPEKRRRTDSFGRS